ncbi:hypothetical protein ACP4OV_008106 [Aristida adscensionis]
MPGLDSDLHMPDLQAVSAHLTIPVSESPSASPPRLLATGLPGIPEGPEGQAAEVPRSPSGTSAAQKHGRKRPPPAPTTLPAWPSRAPVSTPPALGPSLPAPSRPPAPPAPSRPPAPPRPQPQQQQQQAVAAAMVLEQQNQELARARALFGEYQRLLQAASTAEAEAAAQPQLLRLYTVAGAPAGYETKWDELQPVSQGLLLHIDDKMIEYKYESEHMAQCCRLQGPLLHTRSFEFDDARIIQLPSKWPSIPEELLHLVCCLVSPKDIINMKLCCRDWLDNTPAVVQASNPFFVSLNSKRVLFGSPLHKTIFSVKQRGEMLEAEYCSSNDGLITLMDKNGRISVFEPANGGMRMLPLQSSNDIPVQQAISWCVTADSFGTLTIGGNGKVISASLHGHSLGWMSRRFPCDRSFCLLKLSAPVLQDGRVYCLGANCRLGVYDLDQRSWTVINPDKLALADTGPANKLSDGP